MTNYAHIIMFFNHHAGRDNILIDKPDLVFRQRVSDANGLVPLSYQPDSLDPRGRVITLELRKMF